MLLIGLKGLDTAARELQKWADKKAADMRKAMSLALAKESYRFMGAVKMGLKKGTLGLKPKARYRNEPKDKAYRRSRKDRYPPLSSTGMLRGITYKVNTQNLSLEVGFRAVSAGTAWQAKIAEKSMSGYRWLISDKQKLALRQAGIHLRKTTTSIKVPARDIMGAVLAREGSRMLTNIKHNFDRKMSGERI